MKKYVFILGKNPELSAAEIEAVTDGETVKQTDAFLIREIDDLDCVETMKRLGGTIKIGEVLDKVDVDVITEEVLKQVQDDTGKVKFGISLYNSKPSKMGFEVKKKLKEEGVSSRLVTSKEKALSAVIITKEKVIDFIILENKTLAKTCAVQDFEAYSDRDYGRPARDLLSGSLPPKLAQMMINLSQIKTSDVLLDPFCGSGTVLQEAIVMGYENIIGTDLSEKAIKDTKENLKWLEQTYKLKAKSQKIMELDVRELSTKVEQADVIVTEPYLGPPLKGREDKKKINSIINELEDLYLDAFEQFSKVLKDGSRVVIIFPYFKKYELTLDIISEIKKLGFTQINEDELMYGREGQHVWRQVLIFKTT